MVKIKCLLCSAVCDDDDPDSPHWDAFYWINEHLFDTHKNELFEVTEE